MDQMFPHQDDVMYMYQYFLVPHTHSLEGEMSKYPLCTDLPLRGSHIEES